MSYPQYTQKKPKKKLDENKNSALHNLKELEPTGIFNLSFFTKSPLSNKIPIDPETLAQAFRLIDPYNNKPIHTRKETGSVQFNKLNLMNNPNENSSKEIKPEDYSRYKMNFVEFKRRIQIISPNFPVNELALFTGGKPEIMYSELFELLQDNEINDDMDPLNEAMGMLMNKEGNLDLEKLKNISQQLGYGGLEKKDLEILNECLDIDGDGKIGRNDFEELFKFMKERK